MSTSPDATEVPIRVVVLIRVSTEDQKTKGWSHADQLEGLPRLAREMGWEIADRPNDLGPAIYDEGAASTTSDPSDVLGLDRRPVLAALIDELPETRPTWIVCRNQDRVHRNRLQSEYVMHRLLSVGGAGYAEFRQMRLPAETVDLRDPDRQAWAAVQSAFSVLEKQRTRERADNSRAKRIRERLPNGGRAPYGYVRPKGNKRALYEVNEEEAKVYRRMVEWASVGHGPAYIAKQLNDDNVPTRSGTSTWSATTVRRILESRAPLGEMRASVGRKKGPPQDNWVASGHPPIITREQWDSMRAVRDGVHVPPTSDNRKRRALAGILRCPTCNKTLKAQANRPKRPDGNGRYEYLHYTCRVYAGGCQQQTSISERKAIKELAAKLKARLDAQEAAGWVNAEVKDDLTTLQQLVTKAEADRDAAAQRVDRATDAYENAPDSLIARYGERMQKRQAELIDAETRLAHARQRLVASRAEAEAPRAKLQDLAGILRDWENFTDDTRKRRVLEAVIKSAVVHPPRKGDRIEVTWRD